MLRVGALYGPLEKIGESTITVPAFDSAGFLAHYRRVGHHGACFRQCRLSRSLSASRPSRCLRVPGAGEQDEAGPQGSWAKGPCGLLGRRICGRHLTGSVGTQDQGHLLACRMIQGLRAGGSVARTWQDCVRSSDEASQKGAVARGCLLRRAVNR